MRRYSGRRRRVVVPCAELRRAQYRKGLKAKIVRFIANGHQSRDVREGQRRWKLMCVSDRRRSQICENVVIAGEVVLALAGSKLPITLTVRLGDPGKCASERARAQARTVVAERKRQYR